MNRRLFTLSGISAAAAGLLGRSQASASKSASSDILRMDNGDLMTVGGPYATAEHGEIFQIGVWAQDYWLINHARLGKDHANTRSIESLQAVVDEEVAFAKQWGADPFGTGMGIRLTRPEIAQLRDMIDTYLA